MYSLEYRNLKYWKQTSVVGSYLRPWVKVRNLLFWVNNFPFFAVLLGTLNLDICFVQKQSGISDSKGRRQNPQLLAAAKILQHSRAMYSICYISWLQPAAEYGSQLILTSPLSWINYSYWWGDLMPGVATTRMHEGPA